MSTSTLKGLQKINIVTNKNYKKSGPKSYAYLLSKWGFEPTKPGPYFQVKTSSVQGHHHTFHHHHSAKATHSLRKRHPKSTDSPGTSTPAAGTPSTSTPDSGSEVPAEDIQNDSLYLCPVEIGSPAQTLMLDFDTGSADLWVWSTQLPSSAQKQTGHVIFDPTKSSTFKNSSGSSWKISYGDNSSASGSVGTDNVSLGGLVIKNQSIELAKTLSQQFLEGTGDGLLGLAWGSINTVSPKPVATPVQNMISEQEIPTSAELFTAKLGSWRDASEPDKGAGFYTFGYIDQPTLTASGQQVAWTPVDNSQGFWQFSSTSTVVNGKEVTASGNTAIADTGTTLALVSDEVCEAIYGAIPGAKYDQTNAGWVYPDTVTVDQLPVVTVAVGDTQFLINKEDLGFVSAGNGTIYGGIQSRGSMTFDILGDTFLKNVYAIFDQGNQRFGAVQRPETAQNISAPPQ